MITILNGAQGALHYKNNVPYWGALGVPPKDYTEPFYFESGDGNAQEIHMTYSEAIGYSTPPVFTIESSTDKVNWSTLTTTPSAATINIPATGKLYLRATTNRWVGGSLSTGAMSYNYFSFVNSAGIVTANIKMGGNIMSLLYGTNFNGQKEFPANSDSNFERIFQQHNDMRDRLAQVDISKLILPATTLTDHCYKHMFRYCEGLYNIPLDLLPATTLTNSCYYGMFDGCISITNAPVLSATKLTNYCYEEMFNGCSSLNCVKCTAVSINGYNSHTDWLKNVAATGTFYKAAGVQWPSGADGIPSGWTVVEV